MAIDVRTLSHTPLTVGGFTLTGVVSNAKTMVTGDIDITGTSYTASGEPLTPKDLGLDTIDFITFDIVDVDGTVAAVNQHMRATYDFTAEQLLLWDGNVAASEADDGGQVRFIAFGDSAAAPELT